MNRYGDWILSLLCWDGLLPLAVLFTPGLVMLITPGRQGLMELTAIVVPMAAFFARGVHGFKWYRNCMPRRWQIGLFVAAIILLALADAVFILFESIPNIAKGSDWLVVLVLYAVYLSLMAIALFPTRNRMQDFTLATYMTLNIGQREY